jgi:putative RNA 2'-phosphotransferase
MNNNNISRILVKALRHDPKFLNITLNENGWVKVDDIIESIKFKINVKFTKNDLDEIVKNNDKQRLAYNEDKTLIRASQGHSLNIDLGYTEQTPPNTLYHGTAIKHLDSILTVGLDKRSRTHVHLSSNLFTATSVGKRHGDVVVLVIDTKEMFKLGFKFYKSDNNVWLTDNIPVDFITTL